MDANRLLLSNLLASGIADVHALDAGCLVELAARWSVWLPVNTYTRAPWLAPYAVRRVRIRVDARAPGQRRDLWGFPEPDGRFADDNSLIKGAVLRLPVEPADGPYAGRSITRGLVCCHVWPETTADPLLFSFVPNLVWLPSELARYSDVRPGREAHPVHEELKAIAVSRYRTAPSLVGRSRVSSAWDRLPSPSRTARYQRAINEAQTGERLVALVDKRLDHLESFLSAVLDGSQRPPRFSRRYHAGFGDRIDRSVWPIDEAVERDDLQSLLADIRSCRSE